MSEISNTSSKKCNQEQLFPLHLYQNSKFKQGTQQLLDENLHDQPLNQTTLQQAKQSLKIGEDTNFETPIDKFGSKILQNLGWKEGFGIGKDSTTANAPIEYIPRQYRLGLGAKALTADQITSKRQLTVTENFEASSIGKNIKRVGEELKVKREIKVGSDVQIISGSHAGLTGQVIAMKKQTSFGQEEPSDLYVSVLLSQSQSVIQVKKKRLELRRERSRSRSPQTKELRVEDKPKLKQLKWVCEGITIRCVSKSAHQGKLYGKELEVMTVLDDCKFEAKVDDKIIDNLLERDVETVLPSPKQLQQQQNLQVMIVRGPLKGQTGKVLEIDKNRDRVHIQTEASNVIQLGQDDVSCLSHQD